MLLARGLVADRVVIDCFCGTGALGLEALSRGAATTLMIDQNRRALDLARTNAAALELTQACQFLQADAVHLGPCPNGFGPAGLVFMDPPYHQNLVPPTLERLINGGWVDPHDCCFIIETEADYALQAPPGLQVIQHKTHGAASVFLLETQGI
jgi:16S rRNA (guanine966-N2)-methyltransferase